jgi:hypothetical protein
MIEGLDEYRDQRTCERARASLSDSSVKALDACLGDGCDVMSCVEKLASDKD